MPQQVSDAAPPIPSGLGSVLATDIQYVRDLIASRVRPRWIHCPVAVDDSLKRLSSNGEPPCWLRDAFALQASPSSEVAVLAVGEQAIGRRLKSLSDEEAERIVIEYPAP